MNFEEKYTKHYFKRLYFEIGCYYDGYITFEITNDNKKLQLKFDPYKNVNYTDKKIKIINSKEYNTILQKLCAINIEKWEKEYPHKLYTSYDWKLKIFFKPSIVYEISGSNNFPKDFITFINFIKEYFPEFNPNIHIKTSLNESDLLKLYCKFHTGVIFAEVSIGDKTIFGNNSKNRRIDLVRINNDRKTFRLNYKNHKELFFKLIQNYIPEIVEIKTKLNRLVIGQIIVGEYMFKKKFKVKEATKTILYHEGDEALEYFCKENNINLVKY
jgi:hypothetical protein